MFARVGEIVFKPRAGSRRCRAGSRDRCRRRRRRRPTTAANSSRCAFESLGAVAQALEAKLGPPESVKAVWKPNLSTQVGEEQAQSIMKLIAALEDDDDVQAVFSNFEVDEAVMAKLTAA